jgi:hypothetical protein
MKRADLIAGAALSATAAFAIMFASPALAGSRWTMIPDHFDPGTGGFASPFGINDSGWMTGSIFDPSTFNATGFLRDPGGVYSNFSVAADTEPRGIDNNNRVVGYSIGPGFVFNEFSRAADGTVTWLTNPGTGLPLDGTAQGTNSHGDTVGDYRTGPDGVSGPSHGYILNGSTFTDLLFPGSTQTKGRGINDDGVVVGFESTIGAPPSAFIDNHGVWTSYSHPHANLATVFEDINDNGLIVGQWDHAYSNGRVAFHTFLYDMNTGRVGELNTPDYIQFNQGFGLNNLGQVVVLSAHAWIYQAGGVPEPATWAMMLIGLGALGAAARRRRAALGAPATGF